MGTKRILLTGGGTAGHVTPNLALLPRLRERGYEVSYIGTARGIERTLLESERIPYRTIAAGKLRRYFDVKNLTDVARIGVGFAQSLRHVAAIRPHVLFSKGGFVSCPVVWASWVFRVPVIVHESDISPGLANKLSLPFATKICYSFPETANHLPKSKAVETGIPVREELLRGDPERGKSLCGFSDGKPVVMVIGGSSGAQAINACVREALDALLPRWNICHICGKGNATGDRAGYKQFEYITRELADLFALADIAVSRAGATTLFELRALKKPTLLIPLPLGASRGDQILNAQSFEKRGFSRVLPQEQMTPQSLIEGIAGVFENRTAMADAMKTKVSANGTDAIVGMIDALASR